MSTDKIKQLRQRTGCGIVDCKNALDQAKDDFEQAVELLRIKNKDIVAKKASRTANEGLVGVKSGDKSITCIRINCETDFVANNSEFQSFAMLVLSHANLGESSTVEELLSFNTESGNISDQLTEITSVLKERIVVSDIIQFPNNGQSYYYIHDKSALSSHLGRIAATVSIKGSVENSKKQEVEEAGKKIAMHIAAMNPEYPNVESVPNDFIEARKEEYREEFKDSKKPAEIVEKIINGKIEKVYSSVVLAKQELVTGGGDGISVEKFLKNISEDLEIDNFIRLTI